MKVADPREPKQENWQANDGRAQKKTQDDNQEWAKVVWRECLRLLLNGLLGHRSGPLAKTA